MYDYGPLDIRLPSSPEAAEGAAQMLEMVDSFQDRLVGLATDAADRDSKFLGIPPGSMVASYQVPAIWMRTTVGWATVYQDWPLSTTTDPAIISNAGGWSIGYAELGRNVAGHVDGRIIATRTGAPLVPVNGNVTDTNVVTIRPTYLQARIMTYPVCRTSLGMGVCDLFTSGLIVLSALSSTVDTDQNVYIPISYQGKGLDA